MFSAKEVFFIFEVSKNEFEFWLNKKHKEN